MENNFKSISDKKPLSISQKVLAGILIFAGIIVFSLGIWQFKNTINSPFERAANSDAQNSDSKQEEDKLIAEMRNKDTDQDGLNDYEEFYIYKTSPYLADSDSDNIDDKKEIETGSNPNCGNGQDCGIVNQQEQNIIPENSSPAAADNNTASDIFDFGSLNDLSELDNISEPDLSGMGASATDLFSGLSAQEIRELLKENGLPSEILDKLSDEQLLDAYKTTLKNMNENEVKSP